MINMFEEFEIHLMVDEKPSIYFNDFINKQDICGKYPYILLRCLLNTPQSPEHHPEGNVWNHTMLVLDNAAKVKNLSENPRAFMWSALLHDLGKVTTTKVRKEKITSYDHDKVGAELSREFLETLTGDIQLIKLVATLVRWHMQILFVAKDLPFGDVKQMSQEISIKEIALLSQCDRLGRGEMSEDKIKEEKENVKAFIRKCEEVLSFSKVSI